MSTLAGISANDERTPGGPCRYPVTVHLYGCWEQTAPSVRTVVSACAGPSRFRQWVSQLSLHPVHSPPRPCLALSGPVTAARVIMHTVVTASAVRTSPFGMPGGLWTWLSTASIDSPYFCCTMHLSAGGFVDPDACALLWGLLLRIWGSPCRVRTGEDSKAEETGIQACGSSIGPL